MKKWLIYIGGIATGIIIVMVIMVINQYDYSSNVTNDKPDDSEVFIKAREEALTNILSGRNEKPGRIIDEKSFKVFQVLTKTVALVRGQSEGGYYYGNIYLLVDKSSQILDPDFEFYDGQIVKVNENEKVRMFGTYKYITTDGMHKTVPRIRIINKELPFFN